MAPDTNTDPSTRSFIRFVQSRHLTYLGPKDLGPKRPMAKNRPVCWLGHRLTHSCFTQASGSSVDWAYEKAHVKYSYALELRDQGQTGFMLPNNQVSNLNI